MPNPNPVEHSTAASLLFPSRQHSKSPRRQSNNSNASRASSPRSKRFSSALAAARGTIGWLEYVRRRDHGEVSVEPVLLRMLKCEMCTAPQHMSREEKDESIWDFVLDESGKKVPSLAADNKRANLGLSSRQHSPRKSRAGNRNGTFPVGPQRPVPVRGEEYTGGPSLQLAPDVASSSIDSGSFRSVQPTEREEVLPSEPVSPRRVREMRKSPSHFPATAETQIVTEKFEPLLTEADERAALRVRTRSISPGVVSPRSLRRFMGYGGDAGSTGTTAEHSMAGPRKPLPGEVDEVSRRMNMWQEHEVDLYKEMQQNSAYDRAPVSTEASRSRSASQERSNQLRILASKSPVCKAGRSRPTSNVPQLLRSQKRTPALTGVAAAVHLYHSPSKESTAASQPSLPPLKNLKETLAMSNVQIDPRASGTQSATPGYWRLRNASTTPASPSTATSARPSTVGESAVRGITSSPARTPRRLNDLNDSAPSPRAMQSPVDQSATFVIPPTLQHAQSRRPMSSQYPNAGKGRSSADGPMSTPLRSSSRPRTAGAAIKSPDADDVQVENERLRTVESSVTTAMERLERKKQQSLQYYSPIPVPKSQREEEDEMNTSIQSVSEQLSNLQSSLSRSLKNFSDIVSGAAPDTANAPDTRDDAAQQTQPQPASSTQLTATRRSDGRKIPVFQSSDALSVIPSLFLKDLMLRKFTPVEAALIRYIFHGTVPMKSDEPVKGSAVDDNVWNSPHIPAIDHYNVIRACNDFGRLEYTVQKYEFDRQMRRVEETLTLSEGQLRSLRDGQVMDKKLINAYIRILQYQHQLLSRRTLNTDLYQTNDLNSSTRSSNASSLPSSTVRRIRLCPVNFFTLLNRHENDYAYEVFREGFGDEDVWECEIIFIPFQLPITTSNHWGSIVVNVLSKTMTLVNVSESQASDIFGKLEYFFYIHGPDAFSKAKFARKVDPTASYQNRVDSGAWTCLQAAYLCAQQEYRLPDREFLSFFRMHMLLELFEEARRRYAALHSHESSSNIFLH